MATDYTAQGYRKCRATGKVSFPTKIEARIIIQKLKWSALMRRNKIDGSRLKHRARKVEQRRVYYCEQCKGFHLTKWTKQHFKKYQDVQKRW